MSGATVACGGTAQVPVLIIWHGWLSSSLSIQCQSMWECECPNIAGSFRVNELSRNHIFVQRIVLIHLEAKWVLFLFDEATSHYQIESCHQMDICGSEWSFCYKLCEIVIVNRNWIRESQFLNNYHPYLLRRLAVAAPSASEAFHVLQSWGCVCMAQSV